MRSFVQGGGRVASFGFDAFRRDVRLSGLRLTSPTVPRAVNAFGEATATIRIPAAPLVVSTDRVGLFGGTDGFVGLFTDFEQQTSLARGAKLLATAGRDPHRPAFVAYSLGRGTVLRVGTPEWAGAIANDPEVAAVTERIWTLLSP